jgi:hypothetical protein
MKLRTDDWVKVANNFFKYHKRFRDEIWAVQQEPIQIVIVRPINKTLELLIRHRQQQYCPIDAKYVRLIWRPKFKIGETVQLNKTLDITKNTAAAWYSCRHLLTEGSRGIIKSSLIISRSEQRRYIWEPTEQTRITESGKVLRMKKPKSFCLCNTAFTKIT